MQSGAATHHPGEGQHIDLRRTGAPQDAGAFAYRGAGREHVVDHHEPAPGDAPPRRNAPRTLSARPAALRWPCEGVRRRRFQGIFKSGATGGPPAAWMAWASSAA